MFSERGIEVLAGAVLLGIFVSLVVFITVGVDIDTDVDDFRGTLEDIVGNRSRYLVSHSFSILGNFLIIASAIGLSVLNFGALIVWSRPIPRLLGWLGVGGGILLVLVWLVAISDALFVIPFIGLIAVLLWLLTLGTWLIARGVKAPSLW